MENKILSNLYNMIQRGKLRADFRIRDLKLYYKDELVQLPNNKVAPNSVVKANQKYHSNRGYSQESLHHVFQSKSLEFSRYGSDSDKKR